MDIIINDQTTLDSLDFSKQEKTKVIFEESTSVETAKAVMKTISDLPENGFKYYKDIYPYTKLNFPVEWLVNLDKAIDFNYQVYY